MISLVDVYPPGPRIATDAVPFLYQLLLERPEVANISHREPPSLEEHRQFVYRKPYHAWYVIENGGGQWVGAISVTDRNEVGIAISKACQGMGYAEAALRLLSGYVKPLPAIPGKRPGHFVANVAPDNQASHALFQKLGGRVIQVTYAL